MTSDQLPNLGPARRAVTVVERGQSVLSTDELADLTELLHVLALMFDSPGMLDDDKYEETFGENDSFELGVDAIELLAKNDSLNAIPAIVRFVQSYIGDDLMNEFWMDDIPDALAYYSSSAACLLLDSVIDVSAEECGKPTLIDSVERLSERHSDVADLAQSHVLRGLASANELPIKVNTFLMRLAVQWHLESAAEAIERAFAANRIDVGYMGDWEVVRRELQVEGLGLPMPEEPHHSMGDLGTAVGIGCFSKKPLFLSGELHEKNVETYLQNATRAFASSVEGKSVLENDEEPWTVYQFLEMALNYLGVTVESISLADVEELMLEVFPRKVSLEAKKCNGIIVQLAAFWRFVDRVHDVELAGKIAARLEKLKGQFRNAMTDSSNFGLAKSMFMAGNAAGFDMTTQEGLNDFMVAYNAGIAKQNQQRTDSPHTLQPRTRAPMQTPPPSVSSVTGMSRKQRKKLLGKKKKKR